MLLGLAGSTVKRLNRASKKKADRMTADLNVWVALHVHKKEVAAIQFVEDLLSENEVAKRANRKRTCVKNRAGKRKKIQQQLSIPVSAVDVLCQLALLHLCMTAFKHVGHAYTFMHYCLLLQVHI